LQTLGVDFSSVETDLGGDGPDGLHEEIERRAEFGVDESGSEERDRNLQEECEIGDGSSAN